MMKFCKLPLFLLITAAAPAVASRLLVRTTFAAITGPQECSAVDMGIVEDACLEAILGAQSSQRRQLRVRALPELVDLNERQLQSRTWCMNQCRGWTRSDCITIYPGCKNYQWRRALQNGPPLPLSCDELQDLVDDALDGLIETSAVSQDCVVKLNATRTHECIPVNDVANGTPTTECPATDKLDPSGYCVHSDCMDNFQCPAHSFRILEKMCYTSFDDCECEPGYYKSGSTCVQSPTNSPCAPGKKLDASGYCVLESCSANFQCPINSVRKTDRDCYVNFEDCQCETGFSPRPFGGVDYCVASTCPASANYACPANSARIPGQFCYDNFGDCKCNAGYYPSGQACVLAGTDCAVGSKLDASGFCVKDWCTANFQCPASSSRISGRECYDSFDDCVCDSGYAKNGEVCQQASTICPTGMHLDGSNYCVQDWCLANYQCPAHSYRRDGRSCYNNFEDCQCEAGFAKVGEGCVANCPTGQKLDNFEYCVMNWCMDNYVCPARGVRKPSRECYNDFGDCDCQAGYKKQTNQGSYCIADSCYANLTCPANSYRLPGQNCYDSFNDCVCNTGFQKNGTQCVPIS